ncbi:MAG: response regulator [Treponema sp.]|jgi:CheY-like chemotaxis protein|nr:response regulator [Treponema sp.]
MSENLKEIAEELQKIIHNAETLQKINFMMNNIAGQSNQLLKDLAGSAGPAQPAESDQDLSGTAEKFRKLAEASGKQTKNTAIIIKRIKTSIGILSKYVDTVSEEKPADKPAQKTEKTVSKSGLKKILLVDDDEIHLTITETMLKNNYEVVTAKSGEDALKLCQQGLVPDVILLDLIMPDLDGWDTFDKIKEISSLNDVPIAFFTSIFEIDDIKRAFDIGVDEYISKPVEKDLLIKTLTRMIK